MSTDVQGLECFRSITNYRALRPAPRDKFLSITSRSVKRERRWPNKNANKIIFDERCSLRCKHRLKNEGSNGRINIVFAMPEQSASLRRLLEYYFTLKMKLRLAGNFLALTDHENYITFLI